MTNKMIIFGGGGFVGGNLALIAREKGWKVIIADGVYKEDESELERKVIDITNHMEVEQLISDVKPNAVINVAAIADVDKAECEKELALKVNVQGAANIASSCTVHSSKYIFLSSDAVFDGFGSGYTEEDATNPLNYYGITKVEAEKAVLNKCINSVVIRISLVVGFPIMGGNSFYARLKNKLTEGADVMCPVEEVRTPIDVLTLSECILELAENDYKGLLHIGATNSISRYELTKIVAKKMGFEERRIVPVEMHEGNAIVAVRHKNGIICVKKAQKVLKTRLLSVEEGIERSFKNKV